MQKSILSSCLPAIALLLSSCGPMFPRSEEFNEDFHSSYEMGPGGRLRLSNRNGSLEVTGWDRNSVDVSGTKYGPEREGLQAIKVDIHQSGDTLEIRTRTPNSAGGWWHGGNYGVRYRLRIPRRFVLDRVETTNGSVTVEDVEGGGYVKSTNGKLSFARTSGDYRLETTNGGIELDECSGADRAETTNGPVRARLKNGSLEAHSTNGGIDVRISNPQEGKSLRLSTTNGGATLVMEQFHDNPIRIGTTHGGVTLRLPENVNAQVDATASIGGVSSELPLSSSEDRGKHHLRGRYGSGGPEIELTTSTGGIRIDRS